MGGAGGVGPHQPPSPPGSSGSCQQASANTAVWSAALFASALPGRSGRPAPRWCPPTIEIGQAADESPRCPCRWPRAVLVIGVGDRDGGVQVDRQRLELSVAASGVLVGSRAVLAGPGGGHGRRLASGGPYRLPATNPNPARPANPAPSPVTSNRADVVLRCTCKVKPFLAVTAAFRHPHSPATGGFALEPPRLSIKPAKHPG